MAKGYWINTVRAPIDPDRLAAYGEVGVPAILAGGGRFLARGTAARAYELGAVERTVIIEFDSVEQAVATYEGEAYQEALRRLGPDARRDIRIVAGVD